MTEDLLTWQLRNTGNLAVTIPFPGHHAGFLEHLQAGEWVCPPVYRGSATVSPEDLLLAPDAEGSITILPPSVQVLPRLAAGHYRFGVRLAVGPTGEAWMASREFDVMPLQQDAVALQELLSGDRAELCAFLDPVAELFVLTAEPERLTAWAQKQAISVRRARLVLRSLERHFGPGAVSAIALDAAAANQLAAAVVLLEVGRCSQEVDLCPGFINTVKVALESGAAPDPILINALSEAVDLWPAGVIRAVAGLLAQDPSGPAKRACEDALLLAAALKRHRRESSEVLSALEATPADRVSPEFLSTLRQTLSEEAPAEERLRAGAAPELGMSSAGDAVCSPLSHQLKDMMSRACDTAARARLQAIRLVRIPPPH